MNSQKSKPVNAEVELLIASIDADLKKKSKEKVTAKDLNKQFHAKNQPISHTSGRAPERMNPEDSAAWQATAKVTHVVIQECATCSDTTESIGGEYIRFHSVRPFGGEILRRADQCPNLFLIDSIEEPLEDQIEWHYQKVSRCSGCIKVDQQAQLVLWEEARKREWEEIQPTLKTVDITKPLPSKMVTGEELIIEIEEDNNAQS